jgi:circadian clock protein KaiB
MNHRLVQLRLYVAGLLPNSQQAIANLTAFSERYLLGQHRIEIVDVFESPDRALADRILLTPTLTIVAPPPLRTIVGDLSDTTVLEQAFAVEIDRINAQRVHIPPP